MSVRAIVCQLQRDCNDDVAGTDETRKTRFRNCTRGLHLGASRAAFSPLARRPAEPRISELTNTDIRNFLFLNDNFVHGTNGFFTASVQPRQFSVLLRYDRSVNDLTFTVYWYPTYNVIACISRRKDFTHGLMRWESSSSLLRESPVNSLSRYDRMKFGKNL